MNQAAPNTPEPTQPDPPQDRPGPFLPGRLAAILHLVRGLLGYGRYFAEAAPARAKNVEFATVAAVFGTYNLQLILLRVQRGILRAIALERYLLARADTGRDIEIVKRHILGVAVGFTDDPDADPEQPSDTAAAQPSDTAAAQPSPQPRTKRSRPEPQARASLDPDHPAAFHIYTLEELEAQVRRRPIGRTIIDICNDLGVVPGFCAAGFWSYVHNAIWWYGGSYSAMFQVQKRREASFQKERDRRPDTWHWNWRTRGPDRARQVLGCLIGEAPAIPPDKFLATAPP